MRCRSRARLGGWRLLSGALAFAVLAPSTLVAGMAGPLPAQTRPRRLLSTPLLAHAVQDLNFGTVLPGIPSVISPLNERHAGKFEIRGPIEASVRVEFVLPATLDIVGPGTATIALTFSSTDGALRYHQFPAPIAGVFDPNAPLITTLGPSGILFISLGATALAALGQPGGHYTATIFLTVYNLGS